MSPRRRCCRSTATSRRRSSSTPSARPDELERLAQSDTDPFARYEAMQELMMRALIAGARGEQADREPVIRAIAATLQVQLARSGIQGRGDPAAERKPDRRSDGRGRSRCDPRFAREACARRSARAVATICSPRTAAAAPRATICRRGQGHPPPAHCRARPDRGRGRGAGGSLAKAQFDAADNMTDRQGALGVLVSLERRSGRQRSMPSTSGSTTIRWCSTNGSRCRPRRSGATRSTRC